MIDYKKQKEDLKESVSGLVKLSENLFKMCDILKDEVNKTKATTPEEMQKINEIREKASKLSEHDLIKMNEALNSTIKSHDNATK